MNSHDIDLDLAVVNARKDLNDFFGIIPRQEKLSDAAIAIRTMRLYEKLVKALDAKIARLGMMHGPDLTDSEKEKS